ncbi:MAG TPA: hypothetical protein VKI17_07310, partial [Gemmataceae bacterium]|nr:hypothetical protein [Gemmataceae bacterium]
DFCLAHLAGLALAALVGGEVALVAGVLRARAFGPLAVLFLSVASVTPCLLFVWWRPQFFLGRDGRWMLEKLLAHLTRPAGSAGTAVVKGPRLEEVVECSN